MKAGAVHSVIAAGLDKPQLLARWREEPDLLRRHGVEPEAVDLDALWKFAGLAVKVRHNGLRADFPLTFRLLSVAGLEIELFASYASARAAEGLSYADTSEARAQDLLAFLEGWLDLERREHALLRDLMRYEMALARLGRAAPPEADPPEAQHVARRTPTARSVPRTRGRVVLQETRCDPRALGAVLRERSPRLEDVELGAFHFCYWRRGAAAEVHVIQLDELGFYLLSLADGTRTAAGLSRLLGGGGGRPAKALLKALGEFAAVGLLTFDAAPERAR